jgi:hypothetical protein
MISIVVMILFPFFLLIIMKMMMFLCAEGALRYGALRFTPARRGAFPPCAALRYGSCVCVTVAEHNRGATPTV